MQDDPDRADADNDDIGYHDRYRKERRASYSLVATGILAFAAVLAAIFLNHAAVVGH